MRGGSQKGERRGGRQKGTPNKQTSTIAEVARVYSNEAIEVLAFAMRSGELPTRVLAADKILDRAWGRPRQAITGDDDAPPVRMIVERTIVRAADKI